MYCSLSPLLLASLLSSAIYKPLQTTILPSCISFSWEWFRLPPSVQCYGPPSIVLQALCLLDLIPWILLSYPLYNCKVIPEWPSGFPNLLQFKPEFFNKQVMIWAKVNSRSYFCQLYRAPQSSPAKNITNLILVLTIWGCPVLPCVVGQTCLLWLVCLLLTSLLWPVLHRTVQLQLLWHYWLGHRLGLWWCWMVALEMNQDHSVIFETAPKYCISDSFVNYGGPLHFF